MVTASDRLETDLKGSKADFENFVSEIVTHLDANDLEVQRFDVTITGKLEDQSKPHLAAGVQNTASKPFEWLVERVTAPESLSKRVLRLLGKMAIPAAVLLAIAGIICWQKGEGEYTKACRRFTEADEAVKKIEGQTGWEARKTQLPEAKGKIDAFCNLTNTYHSTRARGYVMGQGATLQKRYETVRNIWEDGFPNFVNGKIAALLEQPITNRLESSCEKIDNLFLNFSPVTDDGKKKKKETEIRWKETRNDIRTTYDSAVIITPVEQRLRELTGVHGYDVLTNLLSIVRIETNVSNLLDRAEGVNAQRDTRLMEEFSVYVTTFGDIASTNATQEKVVWLQDNIDAFMLFVTTNDAIRLEVSNLWVRVKSNAPLWRLSYETNALTQMGDDINSALVSINAENAMNCREDLKRAFAYHPSQEFRVPEGVVNTNAYQTAWTSIWKTIEDKRQKICDDHIASILSRTSGKAQKPIEEQEALKLFEQVWTTETATQEEINTRKEKIKNDLKTKQTTWTRSQEEICEKFIQQTYRGDVFTTQMLKSFVVEYDKQSENPYRDGVLKAETLSRLGKQLENDVEFLESHPDNNSLDARFQSFRVLLNEVTKAQAILCDTWCYRFAMACKDEGRGNINAGAYRCFLRKFTFVEVWGKFEYDLSGWSDTLPVNFEGAEIHVAIHDSQKDELIINKRIPCTSNGKWVPLEFQGEKTRTFGQFDNPTAWLSVYEKFGPLGGGAEKEGTVTNLCSIDLSSVQGNACETTKKTSIRHSGTLTSKDNPTYGLKVNGLWSGKTIGDYLREAKGEPAKPKSQSLIHKKEAEESPR